MPSPPRVSFTRPPASLFFCCGSPSPEPRSSEACLPFARKASWFYDNPKHLFAGISGINICTFFFLTDVQDVSRGSDTIRRRKENALRRARSRFSSLPVGLQVEDAAHPFHATRPTPHGASQSLVQAINVYPIGKNPTCSVPALYVWMRGSTVIRPRTCMMICTPPAAAAAA